MPANVFALWPYPRLSQDRSTPRSEVVGGGCEARLTRAAILAAVKADQKPLPCPSPKIGGGHLSTLDHGAGMGGAALRLTRAFFLC